MSEQILPSFASRFLSSVSLQHALQRSKWSIHTLGWNIPFEGTYQDHEETLHTELKWMNAFEEHRIDLHLNSKKNCHLFYFCFLEYLSRKGRISCPIRSVHLSILRQCNIMDFRNMICSGWCIAWQSLSLQIRIRAGIDSLSRWAMCLNHVHSIG